jgi:hypothetical protein
MAARSAPVTVERIERAMDEVALAIDMAGDRGAVDRMSRQANNAFLCQSKNCTDPGCIDVPIGAV